MPNNLDSIKKVIAATFLSPQQKKLIEDNTDDKGVPFHTEKAIYSPLDYLLYRFDPDSMDIFPFFGRAAKN